MPSPAGRSSVPPIQWVTVAFSVALLLLITALRLAVSNPIEAVGFLYVIPISLLAVESGWRGGCGAAVAAILLTVLWAHVQDVPLGSVGYGARVATFASVGILVGLQTEQRRKLEDERPRLIDELHATAMHDQLTGLPIAVRRPDPTMRTRVDRRTQRDGLHRTRRRRTSSSSCSQTARPLT